MTGFDSKRKASKSLVANPWREAIDAELVCLHLGTVDSFTDAGAALNALINWHVQVALDPEVSSDAQALVDRGATQPQAEPVAWRRYNRSIGWQYEDGVTSFASDPSAEPLYAAPQAAVAEIAALREQVRVLREALEYVLLDEPTGIPRASSACRRVVALALLELTK